MRERGHATEGGDLGNIGGCDYGAHITKDEAEQTCGHRKDDMQ